MLARTPEEITKTLGINNPGAIQLRIDNYANDALSVERSAHWSRVGAADFLTRDEKRQAVGYGAAEAGAGDGEGGEGWTN